MMHQCANFHAVIIFWSSVTVYISLVAISIASQILSLATVAKQRFICSGSTPKMISISGCILVLGYMLLSPFDYVLHCISLFIVYVARQILSLATVAKQRFISSDSTPENDLYIMMHQCAKFHAFISFWVILIVYFTNLRTRF